MNEPNKEQQQQHFGRLNHK